MHAGLGRVQEGLFSRRRTPAEPRGFEASPDCRSLGSHELSQGTQYSRRRKIPAAAVLMLFWRCSAVNLLGLFDQQALGL